MIGRSASQLRDQAAEWVARMDGGNWSDADESALQAWLDADLRRLGALIQAQASWMTLDGAAAADNDVHRGGRFSRRAILATGTSALAASLIGVILLDKPGTQYASGLGEVRRVPLADGSIAALNTDSRVGVAMRRAHRDISLDRGEVWFEVAKDTRRPFVVSAGHVRVRAVGTAFSVRRRDGGADVVVTEGVVETWVEGADGYKVRLRAGQAAYVADNAAIAARNIGTSSADRILAWRSGNIDFDAEPLVEAIAEINRYNRRQVVLLDPSLRREQLDGVFRTNDPEGFANAVHVALNVPIDLSDERMIRLGVPR